MTQEGAALFGRSFEAQRTQRTFAAPLGLEVVGSPSPKRTIQKSFGSCSTGEEDQ